MSKHSAKYNVDLSCSGKKFLLAVWYDRFSFSYRFEIEDALAEVHTLRNAQYLQQVAFAFKEAANVYAPELIEANRDRFFGLARESNNRF